MNKVKALGRGLLLLALVWGAACGQSVEEQIKGHIKKLNSRTPPQARDVHIKKLAQFGDQAIGPLINALKKSKNSIRRGSAAIALGKIGDTAASSALRKAMSNDKDAEVRGRAGAALAEIEGSSAIPDLIKLLHDKHTTPVRFAQSALGKIGQPAVDPLVEELRTTNSLYRKKVGDTLIKMGDLATNSVVSFFRSASNDRQVIAAARILSGIGNKSSSVMSAFRKVKDKYPVFEAGGTTKKNPTHRAIEGYLNDLKQK